MHVQLATYANELHVNVQQSYGIPCIPSDQAVLLQRLEGETAKYP